MGIVEQGVGVGWKPLEVLSIVVATQPNQLPEAQVRSLFVDVNGWFLSSSQNAKLLRFFIPSRLWTSETNATDPGYTYGIHWKLAVRFSDSLNLPNNLVQASYIAGSQIQLTQGAVPASNPARPAQFFPAPGVPEFVSCQGAITMALELVLASGLTQTVVCPVDITCGETWSG